MRRVLFGCMALYFFDLDDNGTLSPDGEGTECIGMAEAKREAITTLAEITRQVLPDGDHHFLTMKVRDDSGKLVLKVAIHFDVDLEPALAGD